MAALPSVPIMEPEKSYQIHLKFQRQRSRTPNTYIISNGFWRSQTLETWSSTTDSTVHLVTGGFQARFALKDLCVGIIGQLYDARIPVLFVLRTLQVQESTTEGLCTRDILKALSRQALEAQREAQTEKSMAANLGKFQRASTDEEWFEILGALLASFQSTVYIVIDLGLLHTDSINDRGFPWIEAFVRVFTILSRQDSSARVKVLLTSYGALPFHVTAQERSTFVTALKTQLVTARHRKAGRGLRPQQTRFKLNNI